MLRYSQASATPNTNVITVLYLSYRLFLEFLSRRLAHPFDECQRTLPLRRGFEKLEN